MFFGILLCVLDLDRFNDRIAVFPELRCSGTQNTVADANQIFDAIHLIQGRNNSELKT